MENNDDRVPESPLEDIKKTLIRKRGNLKRNLTWQDTFLKNYDASKISEVPIRLAKTSEWWNDFEEVQFRIEELDNSSEQSKEREAFCDSFFDIVGRLNQIWNSKSPGLGGGTQSGGLNVQASTGATSKPDVKLPTMEIPHFYGSYKQWSEFNDIFKTLVDSNPNLSDIQKFYYLKGALRGSAAEVVHSLEVSALNYTEAWKLLKDRFENKKLIALSHIESMLNFPNMTKENHTDLRKFVDEVRRDLRALKSLGLGVEHWDTLLIYIFENKLDNITRKEWQKQGSVDTFSTMEEFLKFISDKCAILETTCRNNVSNEHIGKNTKPLKRPTNYQLNYYGTFNKGLHCLQCNSSEHYLQNCKSFIEMTLQGKREFVNKANLCWNCLRQGHRVQTCSSQGCRRCGGKHHSLLHPELSGEKVERQSHREGKNNKVNTGTKEEVFVGHSSSSTSLQVQGGKQVSEVLLSTASIRVQDEKGNLHECRALLDSGSQSSFMTRELGEKLGLTRRKINISILGIGPGITNITHSVRATILSKFSDYRNEGTFLLINTISNSVPSRNIDIRELKIPEGLVLADASFGRPNKVDILIGAAIFWDILEGEKITLGKNMPVIQQTRLGYIIAGPIGIQDGPNIQSSCNLSSTLPIQDQLEKFWVLEEVGNERWLTKEEEACERFFMETTTRKNDGKFVVRLPIRAGSAKLGESLNTALKRFSSMERKFERNDQLKQLYADFMREYIELGHMSKINIGDRGDKQDFETFYLPHHAVVKDNSLTTKLRVVFDASAPTSNGVSLNNKLMVGPKLQDDIFSILLRFRLHDVVITADVEKMFRQVWVAEEDRDLQRILWRFDKEDPIEHYRLNTITYGMASSSYLAVKCLQQMAHLGSIGDSKVSRIITQDFYMDDLLTGANDSKEASFLKDEISHLLSEGGFVLRKWSSNKSEVISGGEDVQNIEHYIAQNDTSKTLGIYWNHQSDTLHFDSLVMDNQYKERGVTKRNILSLISQLFDPLGLISPVIIRAKLMLQAIWKEKLGWDDEVPQEILKGWLALQKEFERLTDFQIKREVPCEKAESIELHGFCDASQRAYGACVFVRSVGKAGQCYVRLLCSKSKVAPLKVISLPRLELCGALLLARLIKSVLQSTDMKPSEVRLWSDSTIVLCWLAGEPSTWTTFVANRTAEIQGLTKGYGWFHVMSENNPADLISRGVDCDNLLNNELWWNGPPWLVEDRDKWPGVEKLNIEAIPEQRTVRQVFSVKQSTSDSIFSVDRFSSFFRLQRSVAFVLRFICNCKVARSLRETGPLTVVELERAWVHIIKCMQLQDFGTEIEELKKGNFVSKSSKLVSLNPFLDDRGLLRVGGRLSNADLDFNQRFPVIISNQNRVSKLVILHEHYKQLHAGPQALLAQIRLKYWPISGRRTVRNVLRGCIACFRINPKNFQQLMGNLPKARVTPSRPFVNCGVDYAGPFTIKVNKTRGRVEIKAYLCVFVCFATRATHLELVTDLSTHAFLNCFKRFIARRGLCRNIYSDNATNFTGANNELQHLFKFLQKGENQGVFSDFFARLAIKWHFIPPRSPHFGGLWESAVKSAKYHLKRVLGQQRLTFEELYTVLTQVESCLNSRPLTPLSEMPDDLYVLTPGHFLIGTSLSALPQEDFSDVSSNRLQRYQLLTQLVQGFWKRWSQEYLGQLQQRSKWTSQGDTMLVGDMVLVRDENLPPMKWQLARVIELHPGTDNKCRVVTIKTANGIFRRAASRLCILPIEKDSAVSNV